MRYKLLGRSGLRVSELALGTMTFGPEWGWGTDKDESRRIFRAYAEAGGNFIDTANRYTEGTAESYVGDFIRNDRDRFVVATKYSLFNHKGDPNAAGNHRKNMRQSLEASLKRLRTDHVDLYWVHAWDFTTPVEEVVRALDDFVRAGKVLYVGISDTPAWIVSQAVTMAELRGWSRFVGLQVQYNLMERSIERDLLPMAEALDLGVTVWGALSSGILTGKYNGHPEVQGRAVRRGAVSEKKLAVAQVVVDIARELGATPSMVAHAWVRQKSRRIIPILGATTVNQLQDNMACLATRLDEACMKRLDAAAPIELGFPHDFLASAPIQELMFGGTGGMIERK
jgi:aryl-alcohol dehydrogenase-like predicted oxidoreductase